MADLVKPCPKAATGKAPLYCEQTWISQPLLLWAGGPTSYGLIHQCGLGGEHPGAHQCSCGAALVSATAREDVSTP